MIEQQDITRVSSVSFEDMQKGDPKVVTKIYAGSPLTVDDVDQALAIHAYAHRRAAELAMAGWQSTVESLVNGTA